MSGFRFFFKTMLAVVAQLLACDGGAKLLIEVGVLGLVEASWFAMTSDFGGEATEGAKSWWRGSAQKKELPPTPALGSKFGACGVPPPPSAVAVESPLPP